MNETTTMKRVDWAPTAQPARIRTVLVLLDLTPVSDRILGRVARLPLADDAAVTLLHVLPDAALEAHDEDEAHTARQVLTEEARQLRLALPRTVRVQPVVKTGALLHEAAALMRDAELVVMGRGSGRAVRDLFLGSTAERVVRRGRVPVLVVRLPARGGYRRPALALDLDLAARDVVGATLRILPPAAPVSVIHACMPPYEDLAAPNFSESVNAARRASWQHRAAGELSAMLAEAVLEAGVPRDEAPMWRLLVRHGPPRTVVTTLAKRLQTDLLVLGTRGHTGIAHMLLGTVAGELLRDASCDVLVVPSTAR